MENNSARIVSLPDQPNSNYSISAVPTQQNQVTLQDQQAINIMKKIRKSAIFTKKNIWIFVILVLALALSINIYSLNTEVKTLLAKLNEMKESPSNNTQTANSQSLPKNTTPKQKKPSAIPKDFITMNDLKVLQDLSLQHTPDRQHNENGQMTFPYPTLGMREPGSLFNFNPVSNEYRKFQQIMDSVFKAYNDTNCQFERYGDATDGGYVLCKNFLNHSKALVNIGVQGRDLFGCQLTSGFPMPNYQYDCTNSVAPHCGTNNNLNLFHSICIGQASEKTNHNGKFYSLKHMIEAYNLVNKPIILKIDVEGAEWPGLRSLPLEYLDNIDQILMEVHLNFGAIKYSNVWGNADILRSIGEKFVSVNLHMNNYGCNHIPNRIYPSDAIEVSLVNKKLITIHKNTTSYALHPKNTPNSPRPDCQIPV